MKALCCSGMTHLMYAVQYGESVGVADWFKSFCAVFHTSTGAAEPEETTPGSKSGRRCGKKQLQSSSQVPFKLLTMPWHSCGHASAAQPAREHSWWSHQCSLLKSARSEVWRLRM